MDNILLINLSGYENKEAKASERIEYNPPFGLLSIATYIELHGYSPVLIDLRYDSLSFNSIKEIIREKKPILVGFCAFTINVDKALLLARNIKAAFKDIKILMGGPHATVQPEYIARHRFVDFIVMKEGEATFLEVCEAIVSNEKTIRFEDIPGLFFRRDEKIFKNNLRKPMEDLDLMPLVKRELVGTEKFGYMVYIITSRGCPNNCIYCACPVIAGARYRTRDIDNVFLEIIDIKHILKEKFKLIYFIDDTFTVLKERVELFSSLNRKYNLNLMWRCESRVDVISKEMLHKMSQGGCIAIHYGIESGSDYVLEKIHKNITLSQAENAIMLAHDSGILVCLYLMLGHYCDTQEYMQDTIDFVKRMAEEYRADVSINYNTPYPGTWQYTHMDRLGMRLVSNKYEDFACYKPIVETDNFSIKDQYEYYYRILPYLNKYNFGMEGFGKIHKDNN